MTQPSESPSDPLVSFIMPAWRPRADWLGQAVESALGQRGCRLELIVVDDGCPEPIADLLSTVRDDRLRVIRVEHGGVSRARNAGLAAARGDRVRFVDCDDVLAPESTARLLRLMGPADDVISYGSTVVCDEELRPRSTISSRLSGSAVIPCLLDRFEVRLPAMLFPRKVTDATGEWNPDLTVCQDWDFVLRALEHARVRGEVRPALYYRRHASSGSHDAVAGWDGIRRVVAGYFDRHPETRGTALERRARAMLVVMQAERETAGRPWRSREFWRAGLADPGAAWRGARRSAGKRVRDTVRRGLRLAVPASLRGWIRAKREGRAVPIPVGAVRFGSLRRTTPISGAWGWDRGGLPVDRYYIERFLVAHAADVRGHVLECKDDAYARKFGGDRVTRIDVLHATPGNPHATIVADLSQGKDIPSGSFDCVILTQVLQFIFDVGAAVCVLHRILRPGGIVLVTVPGVSKISRAGMTHGGEYWRFTTLSLRRLFEQSFPPQAVTVGAQGNVLTAVAFLHGLGSGELTAPELEAHDPDYEVLITLRAVKPGGPS
jgi:SAM-dependent methyltransferase